VLAELAPELSPQAELSIAAAHEIGKHGGPVVEAERLAFEAWSRGHCWALCATWDGKQYRSDAEQGCIVDPRAVTTRLLFAAWRDRAALAARAAGGEVVSIEWEIFSDISYYDMWALRPKGHRNFSETLHFSKREDALFASQVIAAWAAKGITPKNAYVKHKEQNP
jgi:hypothetical protein